MDRFIQHCFQDGLLPQYEVTDRKVLEVGSRDVNGAIRGIVETSLPASYLGVDIEDGPGVDKIVDCEDLIKTFGYNTFDVVISTEMLEHVWQWRECMIEMASVVAADGFLIITTRSPGFPYHEHPDDYWRFTPDFMEQVMTALKFNVVYCLPDIQYPGVIIKGQKSINWKISKGLALQHLRPEPVT